MKVCWIIPGKTALSFHAVMNWNTLKHSSTGKESSICGKKVSLPVKLIDFHGARSKAFKNKLHSKGQALISEIICLCLIIFLLLTDWYLSNVRDCPFPGPLLDPLPSLATKRLLPSSGWLVLSSAASPSPLSNELRYMLCRRLAAKRRCRGDKCLRLASSGDGDVSIDWWRVTPGEVGEVGEVGEGVRDKERPVLARLICRVLPCCKMEWGGIRYNTFLQLSHILTFVLFLARSKIFITVPHGPFGVKFNPFAVNLDLHHQKRVRTF